MIEEYLCVTKKYFSERFSEDIDLILDWRKIANEEVNLWEERSKTKQDLFNKQINSEAAKFYKEELIPQLNIEMKEKLGNGEWILLIQKMRWWLIFIIRIFFTKRYIDFDH